MDWLVGHLVGDYLFQNDWMATTKKENSWKGAAVCAYHSIVWTVCVMLFTEWRNIFAACLLFASHYVIDRWSLGVLWNKRFKQTSWKGLAIVVDNTFHLVCLWWISKYVMGG